MKTSCTKHPSKCSTAPWRGRKVRACGGMELEHLWHVLKKETPGWDWKGVMLLRNLKRDYRLYLEDEARKIEAEETRQAWIANIKKQMRAFREAAEKREAEKRAAAGGG